MPSASVSVDQFLRAIWGEGPGIAELTSIGKAGVKSYPFTYPGSLSSLIGVVPNHNRDANVYMGVCLRREPWPRKTGRLDSQGKEIFEYRGTEDNALSSNLACFVEIDFTGVGHKVGAKTITEEQAKKALKEFPLKPSIIVKSGGGIQIYWLNKEPVTGKDLWRMKAINKAVAIHLGADTQSVDLARILRVPGTKNVKYTPPRDCEISWWHPEHKYTLDDFDFLPVGDSEGPLAANLPHSTALGHAGGHSSAPAAAVAPPGTPGLPPQGRPAPTVELTEDQIAKVGSLFAEIWIEGQRHKMALCVAGMLVNRLITLESARGIVARASIQVGADTEKRLKDVKDTYEAWHRGKNVVGATELSDVIANEFPVGFQKKATETLEKIKKALPKPPAPGKGGGGGDDDDNGAEPNFEIVPPLIKFDSSPARWTVTLRMLEDDRRLSATLETSIVAKFQSFSEGFWEQTNELLIDIKNSRWKGMLRVTPIEVRETPKEAKPEGAIETALDEFLDTAHENPEEGMLRVFPGFDEESRFFKYQALDNFLKNQGQRIERRVVFHHLKALGYAQKPRRFGPKVAKVWWLKMVDGTGPLNGNGNGHPPVNGTPAPAAPQLPTPPPPVPDIFGDPSEDHPYEPGENG
jgi:hypothetical protein